MGLPLFVIKSSFVEQDYQRKASICVKELAKNELISISGKEKGELSNLSLVIFL